MYKLTFCDPYTPKLLEMRQIPPEKVIDKFQEIRWTDHLYNMKDAGRYRDYFCPSFSVENLTLKQGIEFSVMDHEQHNEEWFIFYRRPETVRTWLGLRKEFREAHTSNATGQTRQDVIRCLHAFVHNDFDFLRQKVR